MKAPARNGRIVTFYSYKGGTGRSMAVANVGWILASMGKRVLIIDWDLEAPGVHRYLHPFLEDAELTSTPGLVDFFVAFATAARDRPATESDTKWFEPYASLIPFTVPLRWDHFGSGTLELVPAGKQDAAYAVRATSFDWQHFYEHGGGIFLEAVKQQLRADYDYVLIDSRTGISDTSGICTLQMPDELIAFFTLNRQSIQGAAGIAESAERQRRGVDGKPTLTIWPVPTRVDLAEKERLEAARDVAKASFDRFLAHLRRGERNAHWNKIQVLYHPYYAYEEVLAAFGDPRRTPGSMLESMEAIASLLTRPDPAALPPMPETRRREMLARYGRAGAMPEAVHRETLTRYRGTVPEAFDADAVKASAPPTGRIFVSYRKEDRPIVQDIVAGLAAEGIDDLWMDTRSIPLGADLARAHADAMDSSAAMLYFVSAPKETLSDWREHEMLRGLAADKIVIPVMTGPTDIGDIPAPLRARRAAFARNPEEVRELAKGLRAILETQAKSGAPAIDPDDPQKGRWGGASRRSGRELRAEGRELSPGWFEIVLSVAPTTGDPLRGSIVFHLHPTFAKPVVAVEAEGGQAVLKITTYGAFTVGAVADEGRTTLELDLSTVGSLPAAFRQSG